MDLEKFREFLKSRGIADQKIEENIKNAGSILKVSQGNPVTLSHMDRIARMGEAKKVDPRILESIKRSGALIMEFQKSCESKDGSRASLPAISGEQKPRYPYGFASTYYFKVPFFIIIALSALLLYSRYFPFAPGSPLCRAKIKLDDILFSVPLIGGLPKVVEDSYESAKIAVGNDDLDSAEIYLKKAISYKPDFTEAWYNLGAAQTHKAISLAKSDKDKEALEKFKEAVGSKKRSKDLMDQNIWYKYKDYEQAEVRHDVKEALQFADETTANESALLPLLKMWKE